MNELTGKLHDVVEAKVIAPVPAQRERALLVQLYVLVASASFVALAVAAHFEPYFKIDLTITRAIQSYHGALFDQVMRAVSWVGFMPQSLAVGAIFILALLLAGLKWETLAAIFAGAASAVGAAIKLIVLRPRPSADLVHVFRALPDSGFPSGHVLTAAAFGGFLGFLAYTLLKRSWERTALLIAIAFGIALMGPSRIYMGQHWFSDTMGAYVLGSLWLALSIKLYRRMKHPSHVPQS
jgi:undecaprenyl-diphosphatase